MQYVSPKQSNKMKTFVSISEARYDNWNNDRQMLGDAVAGYPPGGYPQGAFPTQLMGPYPSPRDFGGEPVGGMPPSRRHVHYKHQNLGMSEEDMPFKCSLCGKGYVSHSGLKHHERSHRGKQHMCPLCDSKFTQKFSIKLHLKNVHASIQCTTCMNIFKIGAEFNSHVLHCSSQVNFPTWFVKDFIF